MEVVKRIYKHYEGGSCYHFVDECDCCGEPFCRMCDKHIPSKEEDYLEDEIIEKYEGNPYPRKNTVPQLRPGQETLSQFIENGGE